MKTAGDFKDIGHSQSGIVVQVTMGLVVLTSGVCPGITFSPTTHRRRPICSLLFTTECEYSIFFQVKLALTKLICGGT